MTQKVGLIGWPLEHSVSPAMHNAAFRALGLDWEYDLMPVPPDIAQLGLREPMRHGYVGINVTVPHKEEIARLVKPDDVARAIGAVNTVDFRTNEGANTDTIGLIYDLQANNVALDGANVIVLGAGGAARAAVYGLWKAGANITVVNRTMERAQVMLADLSISAGITGVEVKTLDEAAEQPLDVIVNCTTAGMHPNSDTSPWIEGVPVPRDVTLYDMVYRPKVTTLMRQIESAGGRAIGGLGMLVRQGAASFEMWTGVAPPLDVMFEAAQEALNI